MELIHESLAKAREGLGKHESERDRQRQRDRHRERASKGLVCVTIKLIPMVNDSDFYLIVSLTDFLLLTQFFSLILSYLTSLIKEQINTVQLIVLRSQYLTLGTLRENL